MFKILFSRQSTSMTALGETGCQARTTGSERDEFGLGRSDEGKSKIL